LVRDERGQKMSKSKGNVMDPLDLIERYGADALRFTVCALTGPGRDVKLGPKRVEDHRAFVTKLWNAARFCEMNGIGPRPDFDPAAARLPLSRWILDAANRAGRRRRRRWKRSASTSTPAPASASPAATSATGSWSSPSRC
jgi:valyl-tRNA synthetase